MMQKGNNSVLFINQYYYPDCSATSQLLQQMAEDLATEGRHVTVLTGNSFCAGGKFVTRRHELRNGVAILRMPTLQFGKGSPAGQALNYLSFHILALVSILLLPSFDVVVTLTTPPLIAWLGRFAKVARKSRFVYWVQDLYPDVAAAVGMVHRGSRFFRFCSSISRASLRSADRVIAIGDSMARKLVENGAAPGAIRILPNWSDIPGIQSFADSDAMERNREVNGKSIVLYSGNLGRAHLFDELIAAAAALKDEQGIEFVLAGAGIQSHHLEQQVLQRGLNNVRLIPPVPFSELAGLLEYATIGVVTQKPETAGLLVPSKIYGLMSAAKPVLFIGPENCEAVDIIRTADCGISTAPGDIQAVVHAIHRLCRNPEESRNKGQRGRAWILARGTRSHAVRKFIYLLNEITQPAPFTKAADLSQKGRIAAPAAGSRVA
jgi:colanic acid biosynthesis glycosyl transferase WcaI